MRNYRKKHVQAVYGCNTCLHSGQYFKPEVHGGGSTESCDHAAEKTNLTRDIRFLRGKSTKHCRDWKPIPVEEVR